MRADITHTEGAPGPTLVLDARRLPRREPELLAALGAARQWLVRHGAAELLKIALISPSAHPMSDLDFRFVQVLPNGPVGFDPNGTCGHSILGSVLAAERWGWLPPLAPGARIRVDPLNAGGRVVCELDEVGRSSAGFTVHFLPDPAAGLDDLLLASGPACTLRYPGGRIEASLVAAGNPYVFVDAARLGLHDQDALLAAGPPLFVELQAIRRAAGLRLGRPSGSVFPKIAAIGAYRPGRLAARAISVPGWHPTLALSGLTALAAAAVIPGTVPHRLALRAGCPSGELLVDTARGSQRAEAAVSGAPGRPRLARVSVHRRQAAHRGVVFIEPLRRFAAAEEESCLFELS